MAIKSLISQTRQIKASELYSDVENMAGAEGTTYLNEDLNMLRTQIKNITGLTNWYSVPTGNIASIVSSGVATKKLIQPVQVAGTVTFAAGGVGLTGINSGVASEILNTTTDGYVYDSNITPAVNTKATVMVRDAVTNAVILDINERTIFGVLTFDGVDGGAVTGITGGLLTVKLYTDVNGTATPNDYSGSAEIIIPQRVALGSVDEAFSMVNAGFAGAVGAIELGDRMWTELDPLTGLYGVTDGTNDELGINANSGLTAAINALIPEASKARDIATAVQTVTGVTVNDTTDWALTTNLASEWDGAGVATNYLNGTTTDTNYLQAFKTLDAQLFTVATAAANASSDKIVDILVASVAQGVPVTVPGARTYLNTDKDAMDVLLNGQELISDTVAGGAGLGDYAETSTTSVTFNFPLDASDIVTYKIYKTGN